MSWWAKYGFRKGLSDEKKKAGAPTDENCRYNCRTVFLYYCDYRAKIRRTPGNILIRNSSFDGIDAILNLPFGHKWCCNVSLADIKFESCAFTGLHLPTEIITPDGEPLSLTFDSCRISFAEDYTNAPFIRARGQGNILLSKVDITANDLYIEADSTQNIKTVDTTAINIIKANWPSFKQSSPTDQRRGALLFIDFYVERGRTKCM